MIKHIIFDWGGVLEPDSNWHTAKVLGKKYNCDVEKLYKILDLGEREFHRGEDDYPFFEFISKEFNIPIKEVHKEINHVHYRIHMLDIITQLFKRYNLHILSNQIKSRTAYIEEHEDIHYFRELFFSSEIGISKPDKRLFNYVIKKLDAFPEECLFIDDREENVEAARAVGMFAIHYTRADQLEKELKERKILPKHTLED